MVGVALLAAVAACGGDPGARSGGLGTRPDSSAAGGAGMGGTSTAGSGAGATAGSGGTGVDAAPGDGPPALHPAARRLLPAGAQLLGMHRSACSSGPTSMPAGADRWCAVSLPGATMDALELWVLDVTQALALPAGAVQCDGSSPHCLRLTTDLFGGQPDIGPIYPTAHRFYGDTLIYYANAQSAPADLYRGPVFAWQPGWPAGRPIASNNGVLCNGHPFANVAVCIENVSPDGVSPLTWDIHAGRIDVGPMNKVATIIPAHPDTGALQWGSGFTTSGDHLLFSTPSAATGDRETLFFIRTDDVGRAAPTQLGEPGISRWSLSADSKRVFFLRDYNYNREGEPSGTLYAREFPGGTGETRIQGTRVPGGSTRGVGAFQVLIDEGGKDGGLGLMVDTVAGRGSYRVMKDPMGSADDPARVISVVDDLGTLPTYSPDLRFFYLARAEDFFGTSDSWITRADGTQTCALTQSQSASLFGYPFTSDSSLVFWMDNYDFATDAGEGWVANPDGCTSKRQFSTAIDFWFVDGARALLYSDDSDGQRVTLRYAPVQSGQLGVPLVVQRQAERMFAVLAGFDGVLFTIASDQPSVDGIYYLPVPPP